MLIAFLEGVGHWKWYWSGLFGRVRMRSSRSRQVQVATKKTFFSRFVFFRIRDNLRSHPSEMVQVFADSDSRRNLTLHCFLLVVTRDMSYRPFKMWMWMRGMWDLECGENISLKQIWLIPSNEQWKNNCGVYGIILPSYVGINKPYKDPLWTSQYNGT